MRESEILYPSLSLSQYIKYYWVLKTDEVEPVMIQTIPSGCIHLVFHRGDNLNIQTKGLQPKNFIRGQLLKTDAKFYAIHVSLLEKELQAMGNTEHEQAESIKWYIQEVFIPKYAKNFNKGLTEADIKFHAKIHLTVTIRIIN